MAIELEHLINRIQREAIQKAEAAAERILAQAKTRAADIIRQADAQAAEQLAKAEADAEAYTEQSSRTLEQVARDLLMSIGDGVHDILIGLVQGAVEESMDGNLLRELIGKAVDAYIARNGEESRIRILLNHHDQASLIRYFQHRYQDMVKHDIEFEVNDQIYKGFRISYGEEDVYHDFSDSAIAEALTNYLRPHLSEIVERAARRPGNGQEHKST